MELRTEAIEIPVNGDSIEGTLIAPAAVAKGTPGALLVHGWGGGQEQYVASARAIAALGYACLIFDLRGHAETRGQHETVTREDNLHDVTRGLRFPVARARHRPALDRGDRRELRRLSGRAPPLPQAGVHARAARAGAL